MSMHTLSWDELADAVLTHDPELQHLAWSTDCESPAWSLADTRVAAERTPVSTAVEAILQLRHDVDDHGLAVTLLRGIRPDLTAPQVEGWISELLAQAAAVRDAELSGSRSDFDWAVDQYTAALHTFTAGAR